MRDAGAFRAEKVAAGKVVVDVPVVRRLIARQFPHWADLPIHPVEVDGWDNWTFHLGDELKVRLPSDVGYAEQTDKEAKWLPVLAPQLPLPIPVPVAVGQPDADFPFAWSVQRWMPGHPVSRETVNSLPEFARDLATFLLALQRCPAADAPAAGLHNFHRGGSLCIYDAQTRQSLGALEGRIDTVRAARLWELALQSEWNDPPVWVHGDVAVGNLLVEDGRLTAVIDFGTCAVGDPACDLVISWTFLDAESRRVFHDALGGDDALWHRARGWALWKAMLVLKDNSPIHPSETRPEDVIAVILDEFSTETE